jgi:hypothetical protein
MKKYILLALSILTISCSNECQELATNIFVKYDSQDNIIDYGSGWEKNINLDNFQPINWIGIDGITQANYITVKSTKKIKNVVMVDFQFPYFVVYGNGYNVIVYSFQMNDYRSGNDIFKMIVTYKN